MSTRALPPRFSGNVSAWAGELYEYLMDRDKSRAEGLPASPVLEHQTSEELPRAVSDGVLMYDPALGHPVYSVNGSWERLLTDPTTGAAFPGSPTIGDLHYYTGSPLGMYIYYDAGGGAAWHPVSGGDFGNYLPLAGGTVTGALTLDSTLDIGGTLTVTGSIVSKNGSTLHRDVNNGNMIISGGTASVGGNLVLYGSTHATNAGDWVLRYGTTTVIHWDYSADQVRFQKDVSLENNDLWYANNIGWGASAAGDYIRWNTNDGLRGYENNTFAWRLGSGAGFTTIPSVYNKTTSSSSNVVVTSSGSLIRSTSSGQHKTDIVELDDTEADPIMQLRPVRYKSLHPIDEGRVFSGFIAEEVAAAMPEAMHPDGENYDDRVILARAIKMIQRMRRRILELDTEVDTLKSQNQTLNNRTVQLNNKVTALEARLDALEASR